jgi:hypothetical protein
MAASGDENQETRLSADERRLSQMRRGCRVLGLGCSEREKGGSEERGRKRIQGEAKRKH